MPEPPEYKNPPWPSPGRPDPEYHSDGRRRSMSLHASASLPILRRATPPEPIQSVIDRYRHSVDTNAVAASLVKDRADRDSTDIQLLYSWSRSFDALSKVTHVYTFCVSLFLLLSRTCVPAERPKTGGYGCAWCVPNV